MGLITHAYIRPDGRFSEAAQRKHLTAAERKTVVEGKRGRGSPYPGFELVGGAMVHKGEPFEVSHWHRLGSTMEDMFEHAGYLMTKGVVIVERSTGRKSTNPLDVVKCIAEAIEFYTSRSMPKEYASKIGKRGAKASPATKAKTDRMPNAQVMAILNDWAAYPTIHLALKAINSDKRYPSKWNTAHISREKAAGRMKFLKARPAGPRPAKRDGYKG